MTKADFESKGKAIYEIWKLSLTCQGREWANILDELIKTNSDEVFKKAKLFEEAIQK